MWLIWRLRILICSSFRRYVLCSLASVSWSILWRRCQDFRNSASFSAHSPSSSPPGRRFLSSSSSRTWSLRSFSSDSRREQSSCRFALASWRQFALAIRSSSRSFFCCSKFCCSDRIFSMSFSHLARLSWYLILSLFFSFRSLSFCALRCIVSRMLRSVAFTSLLSFSVCSSFFFCSRRFSRFSASSSSSNRLFSASSLATRAAVSSVSRRMDSNFSVSSIRDFSDVLFALSRLGGGSRLAVEGEWRRVTVLRRGPEPAAEFVSLPGEGIASGRVAFSSMGIELRDPPFSSPWSPPGGP